MYRTPGMIPPSREGASLGDAVPLVIQFVPGTSLLREAELPQDLPIVQNGPPGTFVVFPQGLHVSLPTDQIVLTESSDTGVRVGFGGMSFTGLKNGCLTFHRVRDLQPEDKLSPDRSRLMLLDPAWITAVVISGTQVWPDGQTST